jgi:hypothetical protein
MTNEQIERVISNNINNYKIKTNFNKVEVSSVKTSPARLVKVRLRMTLGNPV